MDGGFLCLLALSVSAGNIDNSRATMLTLFIGLLWWNAFWHGLRYHWWSPYHARIQEVSLLSSMIWRVAILTLIIRAYGLENISKVDAANLSANIVSTLQAGCFFGALLASPIAEKFGRKLALISAALVAIVGIVMQTAASGHLEAMYIGR
jgi:hypothetical protein